MLVAAATSSSCVSSCFLFPERQITITELSMIWTETRIWADVKALASCASWELPATVVTHFWWSRLLAVLTGVLLGLCSAVEVLLSYTHPSQPQRVHLFPRIFLI